MRCVILFLLIIPSFNGIAQNYALYFNSENSWVNYPEVFPAAPGAFTVEYRIKPTGFADYNNRLQGAYDNWGGAFTLHCDASGGFYAGTDVNTRLTPYYDIPGGTGTANEWQHYAFTYDITGEIKFYKNGVLVASKTGVPVSTAWNGFCLGFPYVASGSISGTVDEVRIWNITRTQSDIQATMTSILNGDEVGLYAYWNFDNDNESGHSYDSSPNSFTGDVYDCSYVSNDDPDFEGNNVDMTIDTCIISSSNVIVTPSTDSISCITINIQTSGAINALSIDSINLQIAESVSPFIESYSIFYGQSQSQLNNASVFRLGTIQNNLNQIFVGKTLTPGNNIFKIYFHLSPNLNIDDNCTLQINSLIVSGNEEIQAVNNSSITVVEIPEIISPNSIWFDYPTNASIRQPWQYEQQWMLPNPDPYWEMHAVPIGNSFMGAMIYGSITEERIQFNEKSLWEGGPDVSTFSDPNKQGSYQYLQTIRDYVLAGDTTQAIALSQEHLTGNWSTESNNFGNYQTFGELIVNTGIDESNIANYKRVLSIDSALAKVQFTVSDTVYSREYFCSYPDKVFVSKFSSNKPQSQNLEFYIESPHTHMIYETDNGFKLVGNLQHNHMQIVTRLEVRNTGGTVNFQNNRLVVTGADEVVVIMTSDTEYVLDYPTFTGVNPQQSTEETLETVATKTYSDLKSNHIQDYRNLFDRVSFTLNNDYGDINRTTEERVNAYKAGETDYHLESLFFQFGRYLMISASRPGDLPLNLQGVWNNRIYPGWNSDYHLNINLQMSYWITDVCNLHECFQPLADYVEMLQEPGAETAQAYFNASGWCTNLVSNPFGFTAPSAFDNMFWSYYPVSGAWLCQNIWDHYEFTADLDYLQNKAYPILKSASQFAMDFLYELNDGSLVTCPSWSPEQGTISKGVAHDRQIIWDLLNNTIEASEILNIDETERQEWIDARDRIKPIDIGQYGQIQEWYDDIDDPNNHHRHIAHLYALHPGKQIAPNLSTELADAAEVTLNHRGDLSTGWSMAWKALFWARLGDGNHSYELIKTLMKNEVLPNLLDKCEILFNIDGNFGAPAAMAEMLIQSHLDTIFMLPAVPDAWQTGDVEGLKARGNYELDFTWNNGVLETGLIKAQKQDTCRLVFNDCFVEFPVNQGEEYVLDCDLLTNKKGLEDEFKKSPILYPNPTDKELTIEINDEAYLSGTISIYDITGKTVWSGQANEMNQVIDVSELQSGIYTIQIQKGNKIKVLKLMIN